jgi:putative acetyltransferase
MMQMDVAIQEMTIRDYEEVITLWQSCEGIGLSNADSKESIARFLAANPQQCFVARCDSLLVGAVLCGNDTRRGYLYHLAVHPDHRGRGTGCMLMERCLLTLSRLGIQKCHIFVYKDNQKGIGFWQKADWVERTELIIMSRDIPLTTSLLS